MVMVMVVMMAVVTIGGGIPVTRLRCTRTGLDCASPSLPHLESEIVVFDFLVGGVFSKLVIWDGVSMFYAYVGVSVL